MSLQNYLTAPALALAVFDAKSGAGGGIGQGPL